MNNSDEKNLLYYQREMSFLHQMGGVFAAKYPKIAKRLNFSENLSPDPHVERLLESFAFLTGHLQKDIEDQFPRISTALLKILYPNFANPVPPLSIAHFKPDPNTHPMTTVYPVEKGFTLFAAGEQGEVCRFRITYPVDLWPIEHSEIELTPTAYYDFAGRLTSKNYYLRIRIKSLKTPLQDLGITKLRFFINALPTQANALYQLLFEEDSTIALLPDGEKIPHILPQKSLQQVGFKQDEVIIPMPEQSNPAYGLLQEYFAFPQKFMFFDIENLNFQGAQEYADILIPLSNSKEAQKIIFTPNILLLGCTPIINLFPKTSEPIRFDHRKIEYTLSPDNRRAMTMEVHSIDKVFAANDADPDVVQLEPYFSFNHNAIAGQQTRFWHDRRVPAINPNVPGTDVLLSFVDLDFSVTTPPVETMYARLWCTNRLLAPTVPANAILQADEKAPAESILCLYQPTDPLYPPEDGETQWKLVSHLAVSFLSLSSQGASLQAFKEILGLYTGRDKKKNEAEINSILDMKCEAIVRRFGKDAWRGFTKGTAITLTIDEGNGYGTNNIFLFSAVLSRFFGLYARINSFTELTIKSNRRDGIWKKWDPVAGAETFL